MRLQYDYDMESLLTVPWNENQVQTGELVTVKVITV